MKGKIVNSYSVILLLSTTIILFSCKKEVEKVNTAPTTPVLGSPEFGLRNIDTAITLQWFKSTDAEGEAIQYDLYFGKAMPPVPTISTSDTFYTVSGLDHSSYYQWKVIARDAQDLKSTASITWWFITKKEVPLFNPNVSYGTFYDTRDAQEYKTIDINGTIWMAENMNYACSGSEIYDGDLTNQVYGRLYTFMQAYSNACPIGWHTSTSEDWDNLMDYLGGQKIAGELKETGTKHWASPNVAATNNSGFTALAGGSKWDYPGYGEKYNFAYFWTTDYTGQFTTGLSFEISNYDSTLTTRWVDINRMMSVRCVKNP